jgi:hypothetical protein
MLGTDIGIIRTSALDLPPASFPIAIVQFPLLPRLKSSKNVSFCSNKNSASLPGSNPASVAFAKGVLTPMAMAESTDGFFKQEKARWLA